MDQETQITMARVAKIGEMSEADALRIVNEIYSDGIVSRSEAETLFRLNDTLSASDADWSNRFQEALADFLLTRESPEGWVSDEEAEWLVAQVQMDANDPSVQELDLFLHILRKADGAPPDLAQYVLHALSRRIISEGSASPMMVERMRYALYAGAGEAGLWVSQFEAEILLRTNDAIADADNAPTWNDLFARAVGNHLMARAHPEPRSIEEALSRDAWLKDTTVNPGALFARMGASFFNGTWFAAVTHDEKKAERARMAAADAAHRAAEKITASENDWLVKGIEQDGQVSPAEQALLDFLAAEAPGFAHGLAAAA
ncbi:MAG: hypothetical protein AAFY82_04025 [Pseudomonadota bacterium]